MVTAWKPLQLIDLCQKDFDDDLHLCHDKDDFVWLYYLS